MSAWSIDKKRFPLRIVHIPEDGKRGFQMRDTWGRPVRSGPIEHWPEGHPNYWDRAVPEPCDDSGTEDGCRERDGHMGAHIPTPEQARYYNA